MYGKCKKCGYEAGFLNLKKGICASCSNENSKEIYQNIVNNAIKDIKERWLEYNELFVFKKETPLVEIIDLFSQVAIIPFTKKYKLLTLNPITGQTDAELFIIIIFNAIIDSETYSEQDVGIASKKILDKYEKQ